MKVKLKDKLSRALSLLLAIILILVGVVVTDTYYSIDSDIAYAAESSTIGSGSYPTGAVGGATLTAGTTYTFGGYSWVCAETSGNLAVLQSTGVTGGAWPGYTMSKFGNNNYYSSNIDGQDISDYNQKTKDLYAAIKAAEYTSAPYGKGLFLVSNAKCNQTSAGYQGSGNYWTALTTAATNYSSFGASDSHAWLGTVGGSNNAWCVNSNGNVDYDDYQGNSYVVAPAFNLDTSKVSLSGTSLTVATFKHSTALTATQSITSGTEGGTVDLSKVFSSVTYADGTNAGKNASYKISSTVGSINGTTWNLPTGITSAQTVSLTITDTISGKNLTKNVNFTVNPRAAGSISVDTPNLPEFVTVGETMDLAPYITVTGYDAGTQVDGKITSYTLSSPDGTFSGTTFTPGNVSSAKTTTVTVTATGNVGNVNYNGKTAQFNLKIKPDTTGWTDRDEDVDEIGFHTYTDSTTNIEWKYKCNDDGNIQYLYTTGNVEKIISDGHVLLVPSTINGIQVIGIGGGTNDGGGTVIPFIPTTGENANNTWTSIYIPSSVSIINDGAFEANKASASIVIPGTVRRIGVDAFKGSKITSVIFNDANSLYLNTQSFAEIPTLTKVSFRGNGVTLGQRSFANDTGLTTVDIPNGTKFVGAEQNSQNDSFAFQGTTGLTLVKIDTDTVYSNIFSANKNLSKVIFGDNVNTVKYDWSGTATSNADTEAATVARTTYSLNAETVFEMDKTSGGSPFGYANSLTVIGKNKDINGDSNAYNNTADPVKAKIAYLATYYTTNNEVKGYAKGTGSSITITAEGDPSSNNGVTETVTNEQTGIEAYYKGVIFTGKKLDKSKMTVYKMFDTLKNGLYETTDFYVLRTNDANTLLAVDNTNEKNAGGKYVATYTDDIIASFEEKDSITINDTDLAAGTVDVKVVVLQKDENGKIYIDHSNGHVIAFVYTVAVPVKAYTAENDFFENYGSYSSVINTVNSLKETNATLNSNIANLESQISEKNTQISDLNAQISQAEGDISTLQSQKAALEQQKQALEADKESLQKDLDDASQKLNDVINNYAKLLDSTKLDKSDYTYSVTEDGVTKDYVLVNGDEAEYDKSSATEMVLPSGKTVTVYTGTDKDGNEFYFYVDDDGVHVVTIESGNITSDTVSSDTIVALQHKIAAQLQLMKDQLSKMKSALDEIAGSLNIDDLENKTDDEKVEAIKNAINALNNKVSDLEKSVASKDKLIETLREQNGQQAATIEQANKTIENLNNQITAVQGKLTETQTALNAANKNLDTANGNLSDAQQQISTISENLEKTENDLAAAQEALAEKQTDLDQANALIESTNAALTKAQEDLSTARNDLSEVQKTLSDTQAELEAVKTALNTANASLAGAQQEITSLTTEIENLRDTIAGYQSMLDSIKNALGLTSEAENTEILAEISDLDTRLSTLDEKIVSLASLLGIDTIGKTDSAVMHEIISKVTALTKDYDSVTKNYNKIVKKIYGADETVDISNKSVDEVLAAIDSLSGDTSAIAKQLQEAITGKTVSDSDLMQLSALLDQVKTMKSDLDQKSDLLNQIMEALGITDSAQILQTILNLKTQVATLEKENAELKAGGTTGGGTGYTKDTEVNTSSASYSSGYNAGYVAGAQASNNNNTASVQISSLTSQVTSLTKENAQLKEENEFLSDGIDNLYEQVNDAGVSASILSLNGVSSSRVSKLQKIGNAISNLIDNNKNSTTENKALQSQNKKLTDENKILQGSNEKLSSKNKSLTAKNNKLSASEKRLETQVSSLQSQVEALKKSNSTSSTTASRYNTATGVANNGYTSNTASVKPSSNTNTTESATGTEGTEDKSKVSDTETDKKKNKKPVSDEASIEGAEIIQNTALDVGSGTERQLGEVFETMLPTSTTKAGTQNASTTLNINEGEVADITTNAKETSLATEEQKNNALKIVNWYLNNLEELGNLGSPEIKAAATDPVKSVTFDVLTSIDLTPSDEQQKAIDNQQDVNLTVSSSEIEDGALYLIVHESDLRKGTFDVLLTRAYGNEIDINVPDLSPVTLTKITINDVNSISSESTEISTEDTPQEIQDNDKENSGFRVVMYILLFVAVGSAGVLFVLAKRRNGGFKRK